MFSDSDKFATVMKLGRTQVIHRRDIGPNSSWVDRTINGVSIDDSCAWDLSSSQISCLINAGKEAEQGTIVVGERHVIGDIVNSISDPSFEKGTGDKKKFFRKRNIPKSKKKNYTVKPKTCAQKDKRDINKDKFDDIIHTKEFEEMTSSNAIKDDISAEYLESLDMAEDSCDHDCVIKIPEIHAIPCSVAMSNDTKYFIDTTGSPPPVRWPVGCVQTDNCYRIVRYNAGEDEYAYSELRERDPGAYDPGSLDRVMWCPPRNWLKPVIYWDKIISEIDTQRLGYRRPYTYEPVVDRRKATIKFHDHNL